MLERSLLAQHSLFHASSVAETFAVAATLRKQKQDIAAATRAYPETVAKPNTTNHQATTPGETGRTTQSTTPYLQPNAVNDVFRPPHNLPPHSYMDHGLNKLLNKSKTDLQIK